MLIKSIKLQNIRSYVEESISFPEGSVLLAGDIGAGKSTILLAIEYALFGTKRGELEPYSLLRNGTHAGRIELVIELNGKETKICRTIRRTPNAVKQESGYLIINNARIDATPMELKAKIIEMLGYPKEAMTQSRDLIYRYTVYTPQEQMRQILYEDKETRLNTLRKVFNIDKYKRLKENAQVITKEMRIRKRILEENISTLHRLCEQKKILEQQRKNTEKKYKECIPVLLEIQEKIKKIKSDVAETEAGQNKVIELKQRLAVCESGLEKNTAQQKVFLEKIQQLQEQIGEFKKKKILIPKKPTEKTKKAIEDEIEKDEQVLEKIRQDILLLSQEQKNIEGNAKQMEYDISSMYMAVQQIQSCKQHIAQLEKELQKKESLEKKIKEHEQKLMEMAKLIAVLELKQKTAKETMERLKALDTCTLCLQHVDHEHKERIIVAQQLLFDESIHDSKKNEEKRQHICEEIEFMQQQLKEILLAEKKKIEELSALDTLIKKEEEMKVKKKELQQKKQQILELQKKFSALQEIPLEQLQQKIMGNKNLIQQHYIWETSVLEQKNNELLIKDKEIQMLQVKKELQQAEEQKQQLMQEQSLSVSQLASYKDIELVAKKLKQELQQIEGHEKKQEILLATLEKEITNLQEQEGIVEKDISEKEEIKKQIQKIAMSEQWLEDFFIPLVSSMEKQVMLQLHSSFSELFNKWFITLMGDAMTARLNEEFTPLIEQNGFETEVTDLSGGEKTAVALAYRLALNKVINDFMTMITTKDVIILDEPTDGFSAEQLDKVREVLDELQMRQVILVSHETKIEGFVEHVLRIEKRGHVSQIVRY